MKKLFFLAAIAAATLSSCSSDEIVEQATQKPVEDGAVMFSAYTARTTRAISMSNTELGELGFGVFAYEQNTTPWNTYRAGNTYPNFFYNQKVAQGVNTASKYAYGSGTTAAPTNLATFAKAPAAIKALYTVASTAVKVASASIVFTDDQMNALIALGLSDSGSDWTKATDNNTYGGSTTITYDQYDALAAPLWANKATLFALNGSLAFVAGTSAPDLDHDAYNALPADAQTYYTYTAATLDGEWAYSPIKYFSNNKNALHSFFAYAPYQKDVKAVFTDNGPAVRYNAADDYDLLYATPAPSSGTNAVTNSVNQLIDVEKASTTGVIGMNFQHALSKVSFEATYFVDKVHDGSHNTNGDFLDKNTTIVIRSVKFVGQVPSQGLLNLYDGSWTYEKVEESACEIISGTTFSWDGSTDDASGTYKPLKSNMTVIPTQAGDKVQIQIVYDVITKDYTNPKNNSTVTNTITSDNTYELAQGKSYKFKLDLGLTSVKFGAAVADWTAAADEYVDLPNNH